MRHLLFLLSAEPRAAAGTRKGRIARQSLHRVSVCYSRLQDVIA